MGRAERMFPRHRYEFLGLTMLLILALLVWLSIAMFEQQFTSTTPVSLHISRAGLQLLPGSDVKVRGIIVGSVKQISSDGNGAGVATGRARRAMTSSPCMPKAHLLGVWLGVSARTFS